MAKAGTTLRTQGKGIALPAFSGNGGFGLGPVIYRPTVTIPKGVRGQRATKAMK